MCVVVPSFVLTDLKHISGSDLGSKVVKNGSIWDLKCLKSLYRVRGLCLTCELCGEEETEEGDIDSVCGTFLSLSIVDHGVSELLSGA